MAREGYSGRFDNGGMKIYDPSGVLVFNAPLDIGNLFQVTRGQLRNAVRSGLTAGASTLVCGLGNFTTEQKKRAE